MRVVRIDFWMTGQPEVGCVFAIRTDKRASRQRLIS